MLGGRLVKSDARIVRHGRSVIFQMTDVIVPRVVSANPDRYRGAASGRPVYRRDVRLNEMWHSRSDFGAFR
jgi:hypothetical protein